MQRQFNRLELGAQSSDLDFAKRALGAGPRDYIFLQHGGQISPEVETQLKETFQFTQFDISSLKSLGGFPILVMTLNGGDSVDAAKVAASVLLEQAQPQARVVFKHSGCAALTVVRA